MAKKFEITANNTILELLKHKPLDEISAADITDAAGLTKQAFYYHAKNLPDFLCLQIDRKIKRISADRNDSVNEAVPIMKQILLSFRENKTLCMAMMQSKHKDRYLKRLYDSLYSVILKRVHHQAALLLKEPCDRTVELLTAYITDSIHGVLKRDLQSGITDDVNEIVSNYKLFFHEAYSITIAKYFRASNA